MRGFNREYINKLILQRIGVKALHVFVLVVMLIIVSNSLFYFSNNGLHKQNKENLFDYAKELSGSEKINDSVGEKRANMYVVYYSKHGEIDGDNGFFINFVNATDFKKEINKEEIGKIRHVSINDSIYSTTILEHTPSNGYVQVLSCVDDLMYASKKLSNQFVWQVVLLFGVAILLVVFSAIHEIKPYKAIFKRMSTFMSNMTHEFGTPLSIIQTSVESVLAKNILPQDTEEYNRLNTAILEVKRLKKMTSDLMVITRYDNNALQIDARSVTIENELSDIVEVSCLLAEAQEKSMQFIVQGETRKVIVDIDKLKQCVIALIDNAIKYTTEGCNIDIILTYYQFYYTIEVVDNGESISEADLKNLFDRFYRTDKARASNVGGSGLGLSIVSAIVSRLKGQIDAENVEPTGFKITMYLPYDCTSNASMLKTINPIHKKQKKYAKK